MSKFHLGLLIGIFVGTWIGIFIIGLLNIAKRGDEDIKRLLAKKADEKKEDLEGFAKDKY